MDIRKGLLLLSVAGLSAWVACGDRTPPVLRNFSITQPNAQAPLAAVLSVLTDEPVRVKVDVSGGLEDVIRKEASRFLTTHQVLVQGLVPGRTHQVTLTVEDEAGNYFSADPVVITTAPLPESFPSLDLKASNPARMEPGLTMFALYRWPDGGEIDHRSGLIVVLDASGRLAWYYQADHSIGDVIQLKNGNLLYETDVDGAWGRFIEIDALGRMVGSWHSRTLIDAGLGDSILVNVDSFHHEMVELANGSLLTLSSEIRTFDDYPSSEDDPDAPRVTQDVVGDVIVEFNRKGEVEYKVSLFDVIDPYRIGYDSLGREFWRTTYQPLMDAEPELADWGHANSLIYDSATDSYVVGLRHQDAIIKIERSTKKISWILGPHNGWRPPWTRYLLAPLNGTTWAYHSHGVDLTPQGTFLLFDNGNNRASAFEKKNPLGEAYSRIIEFRVDEDAMTVNEVWSYRGADEEQFYSSFLSDADWLPVTGNVLVTDGARTRTVEDGKGELTDHNWARIIELTYEASAQTVFEMVVDDEPPAGWRVYRAQRIAGLYPPEVEPQEDIAELPDFTVSGNLLENQTETDR